MASSCGPFHEEALRRQRVIDKKRDAIHRLNLLKKQEEAMAIEKANYDQTMKQKRHDEKMKELEKHLNDVKGQRDKRGHKKVV